MMEIDDVGQVSHSASARKEKTDRNECDFRHAFYPRKLRLKRDRSNDSLRSCPENSIAEQDLRRKAMAQTIGRRNSWPSPPELMLLSEVADKYQKLEEDTVANGGRRRVASVRNSTYYPHKSPRVPLRRHSFNSPQISRAAFRKSALLRLHQMKLLGRGRERIPENESKCKLADRGHIPTKSNIPRARSLPPVNNDPHLAQIAKRGVISLPDKKQFQGTRETLIRSVNREQIGKRDSNLDKIYGYPGKSQDEIRERPLRRVSLPSSLRRKIITMSQASSPFFPCDGLDAIQSSREREILMKKRMLMKEMREEHLRQKLQQLRIHRKRQIYHEKLRRSHEGNMRDTTSIEISKNITMKPRLDPNFELSGNEDATHCFQRAQIG